MRLFRRIKDPVEGTAQVVSCSAYSGEGVWQNTRLTLVVQALGVEPFTVEKHCLAPASRWPHPGTQLPVVFDREHTDRLDIKWDAVPTGQERAREQAEALRSALAGQPQAQTTTHTQVIDLTGDPQARGAILGAVEAMTGQDLDGDGRVGPAASAAPQEDPTSELERLAKLHAGGALTDEEFAEAKRRVLGG